MTAAAVVFPLVTLGYWLAVGTSATWDPGALARTAWATLGVAAAGAALTTVLALPVGVVAARHRGRGARLLEQAAYAGHALPGITVALSLVFFAVRYVYPLYQQLPCWSARTPSSSSRSWWPPPAPPSCRHRPYWRTSPARWADRLCGCCAK